MTGYGLFKTITAGAAMVIGVVMLTVPGRPGRLVPCLVVGFLALAAVADFLESRADRADDGEADR